MSTFSTLVYCALISVAFGGLVIIESGTSGKVGPKLENGFKFCPEEFSSLGFSIECRLPEGSTYADITVNGKTIREGSAPYHAAGDVGPSVVPLTVPEGPIDVSCKGSTGVSYTVQGIIGCEMMMTSPSPMMMEMTPLPMMEYTPSPIQQDERAMQSTSPRPSYIPLPEDPRAMQSTAPAPSSPMPSSSSIPTTTASATPSPSMAMKEEESKNVVTKKDEVEEPPMMEVMTPSDASYCVTKTGTDTEGPLAPGWVASGTAVSFKPNDGNQKTVKAKEDETNVYKFSVPYKSNYAVTLDMTTSAGSEHNDVWIRCDGGFNLRRKNNPPTTGTGFIKVYHNKNDRAKIAGSIDFNPHALSTMKELMPGMTYTCEIGGRSTKTTVHGLIMFPCKGEECQTDSKVWKDGLEKCNV